MTGISGQWQAELNIDGRDIQVWFGAFKHIIVRSGIHRNLPTLDVMLEDQGAAVFNAVGPHDGMKVNVLMGDGRNAEPYTGTFSVVGDPQGRPVRNGIELKFNAVYDAVPWMRKVTDTHFKGTSSMLIAKLAAEAGLKPKVDMTADMMTWLPNRKPLASYARMAAERGFAGSKSCMLLGVTEAGTLLYRNLENILGMGPTVKFGRGPGMVDVDQFEIAGKSHVYNSAGAWGSTTIGDKLTGELFQATKSIASQFSGIMGASSAISGLLGEFGGRVIPLPINPGNTHEKYFDAIHQNRRIKSLYGFDVHLLIPQVSGAQLLDKVYWEARNPLTGSIMPRLVGEYIVTNKVLVISNNMYAEKITLTSQGAPGAD